MCRFSSLLLWLLLLLLLGRLATCTDITNDPTAIVVATRIDHSSTDALPRPWTEIYTEEVARTSPSLDRIKK